jgi:hypothetical protein
MCNTPPGICYGIIICANICQYCLSTWLMLYHNKGEGVWMKSRSSKYIMVPMPLFLNAGEAASGGYAFALHDQSSGFKQNPVSANEYTPRWMQPSTSHEFTLARKKRPVVLWKTHKSGQPNTYEVATILSSVKTIIGNEGNESPWRISIASMSMSIVSCPVFEPSSNWQLKVIGYAKAGPTAKTKIVIKQRISNPPSQYRGMIT